jgi:hypothetical protein
MSCPSITMFASAARGCTCGVLKPHGPRKPTVIDVLVPIKGGKVWRSALTVLPPIIRALTLCDYGVLYGIENGIIELKGYAGGIN